MCKVIDARDRFGGGAYDPRSADGETHENDPPEYIAANLATGEALRDIANTAGETEGREADERARLMSALDRHGVNAIVGAARERVRFEVVD